MGSRGDEVNVGGWPVFYETVIARVVCGVGVTARGVGVKESGSLLAKSLGCGVGVAA